MIRNHMYGLKLDNAQERPNLFPRGENPRITPRRSIIHTRAPPIERSTILIAANLRLFCLLCLRARLERVRVYDHSRIAIYIKEDVIYRNRL